MTVEAILGSDQTVVPIVHDVGDDAVSIELPATVYGHGNPGSMLLIGLRGTSDSSLWRSSIRVPVDTFLEPDEVEGFDDGVDSYVLVKFREDWQYVPGQETIVTQIFIDGTEIPYRVTVV